MASSPTTTLDARYSASDATPTTWEETRRVIEAANSSGLQPFGATADLTSPRWSRSAPTRPSTGPAEQKGVNLPSHSHVILTTGSNGWESGLDVVVGGDAVRTTEDEALRRLAAAWTRKWDGRWQYGVQDGCFKHPQGHEGVLVFSVVPMKVLASAKGSFSHTRHDF